MLKKNSKYYFLSLFATIAHAAAIDKLKSFVAATHSAQANFSQELLDKNGKRIQSLRGDAVRASGKVSLGISKAV